MNGPRPYALAVVCLPAEDLATLLDWVARHEPSGEFRALAPCLGITNEMVGLGGLLSHSAEVLRNTPTEGETR